jgi:hypothetical protein
MRADAAEELGSSKDQARRLRDEISGHDLSYDHFPQEVLVIYG